MTFFKRLLIAFLLLGAISCQKEYAPEPVAGGGSTGGGSSSGGGGGSSTSRLSKVVMTTGNLTSTKTYEYNSAGKLSKCSTTSVALGQTLISSAYTINRDNNNKILSFLINHVITGVSFPVNGITYTCHYPAGSDLFDYATARYNLDGESEVDSLSFGIANGGITSMTPFNNESNAGYQLQSTSTFSIDNSGNMTELKMYTPSGITGKLDLLYTIVYSNDGKPNALQLGQEAFVISDGVNDYINISKNNFSKLVQTDYTTVQAGLTTTTNYTYTYNANNQPITANGTDSKGAKAVITYTYQ